MSLDRMALAVKRARLRQNDRKWFVTWVTEYATFHQMSDATELTIDADRCVAFLKLIKSRGHKPWQRLQAVRALDFYRTEVLGMNDSALSSIRETLAGSAADERRAAATEREDQEHNWAVTLIRPSRNCSSSNCGT